MRFFIADSTAPFAGAVTVVAVRNASCHGSRNVYLKALALGVLTAGAAGCAAPIASDAGFVRSDADATVRVVDSGTGSDVSATDISTDQVNEADVIEQPEASVDSGHSGDAGVCSLGETACGISGCVNTLNNRMHCGACDRACPIGQFCVGSNCQVECPAPDQVCVNGGVMTCVDVRSDNLNCGRCGVQCAMGQSCVAGSCRIDCPAPNRVCAVGAMMTCVDLLTNSSHCGACGASCPAGRSCVRGQCACPAGSTLCGATCVNLTSDPAHCGGCATVCGAGQQCVAGVCRGGCVAPNQLCSVGGVQTCVNPQTDVNNCGMCGQSCAAPNAMPTCASGRCAIGACNAGFANCDLIVANGCEVNTNTSVSHCGRCNNACPAPANASAQCSAGVCGVGACNAGFANCDRSVLNGCEANLLSDANNCGACGVICPGGANAVPICGMGRCGLSCGRGWVDCDGAPDTGCEANVLTDARNCGGCGVVCRLGQTCRAGVCG